MLNNDPANRDLPPAVRDRLYETPDYDPRRQPGDSVVPPVPTVETLIRKYADELQKIYDNQTAGDYTFHGILGAFLTELRDHGFAKKADGAD